MPLKPLPTVLIGNAKVGISLPIEFGMGVSTQWLKILITAICFYICSTAFAVEEKKTLSPEELLAQKRAEITAERKANRKKLKKRFFGYRKYSKEFRALCEGMALDGRSNFFQKLGENNNEKVTGCIGCKFFYKQLASSCRAKVKRKSKSKETEALKREPFKQLTPHVVVLQRASEIGYILMNDTDWMHEHYVVLKNVESKLATSTDFTHGEKTYSGLVLHAMLTHFASYKAALERKANKSKSSKQSQSFYERDKAVEAEMLRDLFDRDP